MNESRRFERASITRSAMAVLMAVQFAFGVLLPVLDARLEARSEGAFAHFESDTAARCIPLHDHSHCAVCRGLGGTPSTDNRCQSSLAVPRVEAPTVDGDLLAAPWTGTGVNGSRAPPAQIIASL